MLSRTAKESIKTALAMTLAFGIALAMDWDKPLWAGLAVSACSLATIGQSLSKAGARLLGTLVASAVAMVILALTIQDRWLFMVALSAWMGFCTYRLGGSEMPYAWQVAGFVCCIIAIEASGDPVNAFTLAMLRTQETALGVVVYSLVSIFIWPARSGPQFEAVARERAATQQKLFHLYRELLRRGKEGGEDARELRVALLQQQRQFDSLLESAHADSPEIAETADLWEAYRREAAALAEHLTRWEEGFDELKTLDLDRLVPGLDAFQAEIDRRLGQVERMLGGQPPECAPEPVTVEVDAVARQGLSHFEAAAVAVGKLRLERIASSARTLFGLVADIRGFGEASQGQAPEATLPRGPWFVLDPDRLLAAVRVVAALWMAHLAVIYISGLPGGFMVVVLTGSMAMSAATMPQVSMTATFAPIAWSTLFATAIYVFVMPRLATFLGLGLLLFAVTFGICYLFSSPKKALGRVAGLTLFIAIAAIDNEQSYNFLSAANLVMIFVSIMVVLMVSAYVPYSPLPERVFMRLARRFFRSCEWLASDLPARPAHRDTPLARWRRSYHLREMTTLPAKLAGWAAFIDTRALPGTTAEQIGAVVNGMQAMTGRMQELREASGRTQLPLLEDEIYTWRRELQGLFRRLSNSPESLDGDSLHASLGGFLDQLEVRIKEIGDTVDTSQISDRDGENFYRLLGAFRSVSEALVLYARTADAIDWAQWREERFA